MYFCTGFHRYNATEDNPLLMMNTRTRIILLIVALLCYYMCSIAQVQSDTTIQALSPIGETEIVVSAPISLDSCLSLARQNNKQLLHAKLNIEKAQQVKNQAFTKYFPQITASALGYHSLHPMVEVGSNDINNTSVRDLLNTLYGNYGAALGLDNTISLFQYGYQVGVTALQPVYMGGKIVAGNQLAQVGVEAAQLQTEITERDLLEQVEESYWLVVGLSEKQQTLNAVADLLDSVHRTVQVAVNAGLALQTDLLQVELRQSEIHRTRIQLENGLALAKRALWQSVFPSSNSPDKGYARLQPESIHTDSAMQVPALRNIQETDTPESALLVLQVRAAELQRRMIIADALPQVAVGAHYGYSNVQANFLRGGLGSKNGNGAVFVSVSVPLTGWWETGHKIHESNIAIEQARLEQSQLNEMLDLRTQQIYDKMTESYLLVSENRHALDIARENYRLSRVNYHAGTSNITDLLTAQATLLQAQNNLTDALISYRLHLHRYTHLTLNYELLLLR